MKSFRRSREIKSSRHPSKKAASENQEQTKLIGGVEDQSWLITDRVRED